MKGCYNWVPEKKYAGIEGHAKMALNQALAPFDMYGQGILIPECIETIMGIMRWYGQQVRGKDRPLSKRRG